MLSQFRKTRFFLLSLILASLSPMMLNYSKAGQSPVAHQNANSVQVTDKGRQPNPDAKKVPVTSLSPYEIASFIAENPAIDLKNTWNQLGIKSVNFGDGRDSSAEEQGDEINRFLSKCNNCDVETYSCDLDEEPGKEVLLKVSDLLAESCRYLIFKQLKQSNGKPEWRVLGHIDHGFSRYRMPEHSIHFDDGRNWLVIKVQQGSGSGFAEYDDRLFQVNSTGLNEILRFPSEGHVATCCSSPTREFTTQIRKCEAKNGATMVELEFSVSYSASSGVEYVDLWKKTQKAIYKKEASSDRLVLDARNSDLSDKEITAIYAGEGLSDEAFIKYNFEELSKIALGREDSRKGWLRLYLQEGDKSRGKERLKQLMEK
jgi:hypothetical protein